MHPRIKEALDWLAGIGAPASNTIVEDCAFEQQPSVEELQAELKTLLAALEAERKEARAAVETPKHPYRIVLLDYPDAPSSSGYYVQQWMIEDTGYEEGRNSYFYPYSPFSEAYDLYTRIQNLKDTPHFKYVGLKWINLGASNPHPTFEAAQTWLKKWLRPACENVAITATGRRAPKLGRPAQRRSSK